VDKRSASTFLVMAHADRRVDKRSASTFATPAMVDALRLSTPTRNHHAYSMSTYRRVRIPGGVYFFTVVTHQRAPIFTDPENVAHLREAFRKVMVARPFEMEAVVILPDHLHCLWRLPEGDDDFSGRWREIKKVASRGVNPTTNTRGERPVWQRRFWEHAIRDEADWRSHMDYIHYNPVKHGLVTRPTDWPWSSFSRAVARGWYEPAWGESEPDNIVGMQLE
jgi:putative transposase